MAEHQKHPGGRPVIGDPKDKIVTLRMSSIQHAQLIEYSKKNGLTNTQTLLAGLELLLQKE